MVLQSSPEPARLLVGLYEAVACRGGLIVAWIMFGGFVKEQCLLTGWSAAAS